MKTNKIIPLLTLLFALVLAPACKKAADLMKYKDQATKLIAEYGPKLEALKPKLTGLLGRADALKAIPGADKIPGVSDLMGMLGGADKSTGEISSLMGGLLGKVTDAVKGGKEDDVKKVLEEAKVAGGKIEKMTADLTSAEATMAKIEADAKAMAPAPAGEGAAPAAGGDMGWMFKLASGFELKGAKGGIEDSLIAFVEDKAKAVDKTTWFSFDRLQFKTGSADLDMDKSKDQLNNMNEILKAFPAVKLKVGGYTDNVGKAESNKKLSMERAAAVKKALEGMGIAADRMEAEGYGMEHPVCAANDTDDCKAKNRRIDVRVTAK
jgi:outer membrane protein OmpA-like peptidoglycan-associated protein